MSATTRDLRARLNLTQKQLADKINVTTRTVKRWEKGQARPVGAAARALIAMGWVPPDIGFTEPFKCEAVPHAGVLDGHSVVSAPPVALNIVADALAPAKTTNEVPLSERMRQLREKVSKR